jgi:hypothetical protein
MTVFDNYEISPCRRFEEPDSPGKFYFEVCEPHEADVWTLYGHVNGEGVQAIGDFDTREHAEEVFFRITGLKFTGSYTADAHLRLMHNAAKLLDALIALRDQVTSYGLHEPELQAPFMPEDTLKCVEHAIAEATGEAP